MIASATESGAQNSFLREFAAGTRLAAALAAAFAFSFIRGLPAAGTALAVAAGLALAARPAAGTFIKRLAGVNAFLALVWLTLPLTMPAAGGAPAFAWSPQATDFALLLTVKCNAIFLVFLSLAGGLDAAGAAHALAGLGLPAKLVFLVFFTGRHIHAVAEECKRLRTAAALRAFAAGTNLHTYRTIGNILGLTVVRAAERAGRTHEAMTLRCFDGQFRTIAETKPGRRDACFAAGGLALLAGIILFDAYSAGRA